MSTCVFCREAKDPASCREFLPNHWPYSHRTLWSDDHVFIVPGYGPQVFPYALVLTKRHLTAWSQLDETELASVTAGLTFLAGHEAFGGGGSVFLFEHAGDRSMHSCIDHFHLHVLKTEHSDLGSAIAGRAKVTTEPAQLPRDVAYFACATFNRGTSFDIAWRPHHEKCDQFFRRKLAHKLGHESWDWRLGQNMDFMAHLCHAFGLERLAR